MMGSVLSFRFFVMLGVVFLSAESKKLMESAVYISENGLHCFMCNRGERVQTDCVVNNTQSACEDCTPGITYQEKITKNRSCKICTTCEENEEIYHNCTTIKNALCRCKAGYGSLTDVTENSSSRCFMCPAGDWLNSTTGARICMPGCWPPGTEWDEIRGQCRRCTNCTSGNLLPTLNCTTVPDAECLPETTRLSPGEIVGISISVLIAFIIGLLMVYCCIYRKSSKLSSCVGSIRKQLTTKLTCGQDPETADDTSSPQSAEVAMP